MKKKILENHNFLERIPVANSYLSWFREENGLVTLEIENTGFFNRIAQKIFHKPKFSYVHLDKTGSFVWPLIDGEKNIIELGKLVQDKFGKDAEPLYERLAKFFQILDSYHFITFKQ